MLSVNFHGVRGSYPVSGEKFIRYGGNTPCVSITKLVNNKIVRIIIDAGTGLINLGKEILRNKDTETLTQIILFTHLHPDHSQGFSFFAPNYMPDTVLHLLGMEALKKNVGSVLENEMIPPTFPIEYKDLKSNKKHYRLTDGTVFYVTANKNIILEANSKDMSKISDKENLIFKVKVMQAFSPSHPQQGALYYRITDMETNTSIVCAWDLESKVGGDVRLINFAKDADLLIHDTQYTYDEYFSDKMVVQGFGHSTYEMAIENAVQANVSRLACFHYNPNHTDDMIEKIRKEIEPKSSFNRIEVIFPKDGMSYEL